MLPAEQVTIGGFDYRVRVLTMQDIRAVVRAMKDLGQDGAEIHIIDVLFDHEVPTAALKLATGMDDAALDALPPAEVQALLDAVARVNSFFVETWERRFASRATPSEPSSAPSAA